MDTQNQQLILSAEILKKQESGALSRPDVKESIFQGAEELIRGKENGELSSFLNALETKIKETDADAQVRLNSIYQPLQKKIAWQIFYSLSPEEQNWLMQNWVIKVVKNGIDVKSFIGDYLKFIFDDVNNWQERKRLWETFIKNKEEIGLSSLVDGSREIRPTIENWLKLYNNFLVNFKQDDYTLGMIQFLNNEPNVKKLDGTDKNLLKEAIDFSNWLQFAEFEWTKEAQAIELETISPVMLPTPAREVVSAATVPAPASAKPTLQPVPSPKPAPQPIFAPTIERYDAAAEKLIKESGLNVALELQQRFKMIVVSRLKEVRKWVETRQKLMSPLENGGMGFQYEQAEKFLKLVDEKKDGLLKNPPVAVPVVSAPLKSTPPPPPVLPTPTPAPITYSAPKKVLPLKENFSKDSSLAARNDKNEIASAAPRNDIKKTSSDIVKAPPQPLKIVQQEKAAPKIELAPMPPAQIKPVPKIAIPQTPAGRSKMEDVAYKPRLVGPVEELREMTLVDFRRLSPQAKVTADKIYAKIELLAEESYEKKIAGIKAWQESEVNKMYLRLLNESVDAAKPVQKMIEERQGVGKSTLTYEEFKTVMELNRRLRS